MNTPDTSERRGVISAGGFLPAVKAAMAIGHLQAGVALASWDGNPKGRDSFAGSVRSMTARPDAQNDVQSKRDNGKLTKTIRRETRTLRTGNRFRQRSIDTFFWD